MNQPKRKSDMRWQQGRQMWEIICPTLPTPSHCAVLSYCWFFARGKKCEFVETKRQIAYATGLSEDRVKKILKDLEDGGVIRTTAAAVGRGNACTRVITGRKYQPHTTEPKSEAGPSIIPLRQPKGVAHDPVFAQ